MWAQYRKTFLVTQILIFCVAVAGLLHGSHLREVAVEFFIPMQVCAVLGAVWAARLKSNFGSHPTR